MLKRDKEKKATIEKEEEEAVKEELDFDWDEDLKRMYKHYEKPTIKLGLIYAGGLILFLCTIYFKLKAFM